MSRFLYHSNCFVYLKAFQACDLNELKHKVNTYVWIYLSFGLMSIILNSIQVNIEI